MLPLPQKPIDLEDDGCDIGSATGAALIEIQEPEHADDTLKMVEKDCFGS